MDAKPGFVNFEALMGGVNPAAAAVEELKVNAEEAEERMPVAVPSVVLDETGDIHNNAATTKCPVRLKIDGTDRIAFLSRFAEEGETRAARERCSQGQQSHHGELVHGKISDG